MVIGLIKFWSTIKAIWLDPEAAVSNENLSAWNFISLLALLTNVSPAAWEILRVLLARPKESPVIAPAVSANVDVLPTVSTWFKLPTLAPLGVDQLIPPDPSLVNTSLRFPLVVGYVRPPAVNDPVIVIPLDVNATTVLDPEIQLRVVDVISILPGPLLGSEIISNCPFFSLRIDVVPSWYNWISSWLPNFSLFSLPVELSPNSIILPLTSRLPPSWGVVSSTIFWRPPLPDWSAHFQLVDSFESYTKTLSAPTVPPALICFSSITSSAIVVAPSPDEVTSPLWLGCV